MTLKELDNKIEYKLETLTKAWDKNDATFIITKINMYANLRKSYVIKEPTTNKKD